MIDRNSITAFESKLLDERYYRYLHKSGLPIYVFPKNTASTYALFATDFGSVDAAFCEDGSEPLPDGVAHFLEHKLFFNEDGTDSFERFSAYGADANAYTSHTRTVYLFSCAEDFERSFAELVNFVTHPYFTKESVKKEQGIIGEEIRMCRDNPYDRCYYNMLAGLYESHPVKRDICGSIRSIAEIDADLLYRAYRTFYRLSNMALVVCGNVTPDEVFELAEAHLPQTTPDPLPPRYTVKERKGAFRKRVVAKGQAAKPIFSIGIKDVQIPEDPAKRVKRDAAMAILNEMLFSESGELYNQLYNEGLISPELSAEYAITRDFAFNQISGESDDPDLVLERIKAYIDRVRQNGLSEEDFERCKRVEYAEYIKGFDSVEEIANTLLAFVFDRAELFSYAETVQSLTLFDVEELLRECFDPSFYTLSVVLPRQKNTEVTQ